MLRLNEGAGPKCCGHRHRWEFRNRYCPHFQTMDIFPDVLTGEMGGVPHPECSHDGGEGMALQGTGGIEVV